MKPPIKAFSSAGGRTFTVKEGTHDERWDGDPLWMKTWPITYKGKPAGKLFQSLNYGTTKSGEPRWHASTREIYWAYVKGEAQGIGYDVAAFDSAKEALGAWADSADQILDFAARKKRKK